MNGSLMNFSVPEQGRRDTPACPLIQPPAWLRGGHLQTMYPALFGRLFLNQSAAFVRERLSTPDGDFIDLDWLTPAAVCPAEASGASAAPALLVLFHGLEGSSESPYAQIFGQIAGERGWNYVVVHFRGCSGEINHGPRAYHSGDSTEIDWILSRLLSQLTAHQVLLAVGISLGGNALLRWAGERGQAVRTTGPAVRAAAAISSPLDLAASGRSIDDGVNRWLYARYFLRTMKKKARAKYRQYPGLFDLAAVERATTLRAFDDAFTAPIHGFAGVDDYWRRASAKPVLPAAALPILIVNARNDPFVPEASLPALDEAGPSLSIWRPTMGGHAGFPTASAAGPRRRVDLSVMPRAICDWLAMAAN